ncbi:MAG: cob(I)yrinic acid a,c-diamide adenosyltransferase [Candidatus Harrisonbacteria bacterium]|nr:cob(I)yrinic acid a,c-diamide adenosyltransferase [Candidatus Harrisonbacteria bacterium]
MIVVFTGNGKGKTTASIGAAARAVGRGKRVLMVQFIKGPWKSGEDFINILTGENSPAQTKGEFKLVKKGLGFVGILGDTLPREDHAKAAQEALHYIKEAIASKEWDFIIMDEVNVAVSLNLISAEEVLTVLEGFSEEKILILSGRGAPEVFIERADLVTEMKEIKHPYQEGKDALMSVEF